MIPVSARGSEIILDLENSKSSSLIVYKGEVEQDLLRLQEVVEKTKSERPGKPIVIALNSAGGSHYDGMAIGLYLKRQGIGTAVLPGATCDSACASIFFGGYSQRAGRPNRTVYQDGRLGVHLWRRRDGRMPTYTERARLVSDMTSFLDQVAVPQPLQYKILETPPTNMYYLTASDMAGSAIVVKSAKFAPKLNTLLAGPLTILQNTVIANLSKQIHYNPENSSVYNNRGQFYFQISYFDQAVEDYDKAISLSNKPSSTVYNNRAMAYSGKRQYHRALEDFAKSIEIDPKNAWTYNQRALTLKAKGDTVQAIADYGEAIRLLPKYVVAYQNRALASGLITSS